MKNLKSILAVAAAVTIAAGAAHAAPANATFGFTPNTATNMTMSGSSLTFQGANQTVTVAPYFYVDGNAGGTWNVSGWGAGEDYQLAQTLNIYHNKSFKMTGTGWGTWTGTPTITSTLPTLEARYALTRFSDGQVINGTQTGPDYASAAALNSTIASEVKASDSGGRAVFALDLKLTTAAGTAAGNYTMAPTFTFELLP